MPISTQSENSKAAMLLNACSALIVMMLAILLVSCGGKPSTTPPSAPSPAPSSAPAPTPTAPAQPEKIVWSADGVIGQGEYTNTQSYANYEISWLSDGQYIYIGMKVKTTGWVAIAIQPGTRMKSADIVLGFVKDGKTTVYDQFSKGDFGPHAQDTELGGTMDIPEFAGKEKGGYTTIEFKRQLNTGDEFDNPISKGINQILWAYGSDDNIGFKHANRGYGEIRL